MADCTSARSKFAMYATNGAGWPGIPYHELCRRHPQSEGMSTKTWSTGGCAHHELVHAEVHRRLLDAHRAQQLAHLANVVHDLAAVADPQRGSVAGIAGLPNRALGSIVPAVDVGEHLIVASLVPVKKDRLEAGIL